MVAAGNGRCGTGGFDLAQFRLYRTAKIHLPQPPGFAGAARSPEKSFSAVPKPDRFSDIPEHSAAQFSHWREKRFTGYYWLRSYPNEPGCNC